MPLNNTIVEAEQLAQQLSQHTILDCRFSLADPEEGQRLYDQDHLPGAYYCHLDNDLSSEAGSHGGRHPLPDANVWQHQLQSWGINRLTSVVVYDDHRFAFAARAWWLLKQAGVENVKLLNGGFHAWKTAGLPLDRRTPKLKPVPTDTNLTIHFDHIVDREHVQHMMEAQTSDHIAVDTPALIDSREPSRYRGENEPIDPIAGHIPTALNLPWVDITDDNGFIKPLEFHQQRWAPFKGTTPVAYCGSGVTACVNLLSAYLTQQPIEVYPGSWSDWCSYPEAAVATHEPKAAPQES